jgi:uncharacterized protein YndB with AHSA1/START domain
MQLWSCISDEAIEENIMTALDITRTIDIHAPAKKVWAAITVPDLIAQWFGDTAEFVAEAGAKGEFGWADHGGSFRILVEHVDEPRTLIYRWAREFDVDPAPGNSTLVRFHLEEIPQGTRLTVVETGFEDLPDPQGAHDGNTKGWRAELGELVEFLESQSSDDTDRPAEPRTEEEPDNRARSSKATVS